MTSWLTNFWTPDLIDSSHSSTYDSLAYEFPVWQSD
jgi:hypothetical protein